MSRSQAVRHEESHGPGLLARVRPTRRANPRRPRLEVVEHVAWWRRVSWWELGTGLLLVGVLFAALSLHVAMIGDQERLDRLQQQVDVERTRQEELRRAESQLTSPGEVLAIARDELGMVDAASPEFIESMPRFMRPQPISGGAP